MENIRDGLGKTQAARKRQGSGVRQKSIIQGQDRELSVRRKQSYRTCLGVDPALEDDSRGGLIADVATGMVIGGIAARGLEGGMHLCGREPLIPEVDRKRGVLRLCDEGFQFSDKAMDARGLGACLSGEAEGIAYDDAGASVASGEAQDRALIAARLCPLDGEQRLRNAERVGERDSDAARADVEAEPGLVRAHGVIIVRDAIPPFAED